MTNAEYDQICNSIATNADMTAQESIAIARLAIRKCFLATPGPSFETDTHNLLVEELQRTEANTDFDTLLDVAYDDRYGVQK